MIAFFLTIICFGNVLDARGQGTFHHTTNLMAFLSVSGADISDCSYAGSAVLSYDLLSYKPSSNTVVQCRVNVPVPLLATKGGIYGPASPTQTAPLLFNLGQPSIVTNTACIVTWPEGMSCFTNVYSIYSNMLTLTPSQMHQLNSGSWYVSVSSGAYPTSELRGQFVGEGGSVLNRFRFEESRGIAFTVIGSAHRNYQIEFSTDMLSWFVLTNVNTTNVQFQVFDPEATNSTRRFYRATAL
ncbi:MAG TPA: CHRD domain-containing protein [Clostridia bacterium]|nr:CHRD domain-containing protein [Clostridia bacterium]